MALLVLSAISACAKPAPPVSPTTTVTPTTPPVLPSTATPVPSPTLMPTPTATPRPTPPTVQVPRKEAAYRPEWGEADLRGFDPWGDAGGDQQDMVAVYFRQENSLLRFRVDLLDLRAEQPPDLYLALDFANGGINTLEPGGKEASEISWDTLVKVSGGATAQMAGTDFRPMAGAIAGVKSDSVLDYVTLDIHQSAMSSAPGGPFRFQVLAVASGATEVLDRTEPVSSDASLQGRARLTIWFGNILGPGTPAGVASWYDRQETDRDGKVKPYGWRYLLDGAEKYWLPVTLEVKQTQYLAWTEELGLYARLRACYGAGLCDVPADTLAYGHFMPWQPQDVNARAIALSQQFYQQLALPRSPIFNPYEGQVTVRDLQTIKDAGYEWVAAGAEQEYYRWFGGSMEEAVRAAGKLHRANGIGLIFQRYPWTFTWDPRWGSDPYANWNEQDLWRGTDGGLHLWFRRNLVDMAQDTDQESFVNLGTDINVTPWGFQEVVEANLRWLAEHPWIKVMKVSDLFQQGWHVIDHGDLGLPADTLLPRFSMEGDAHYNAYFSQYYYGGIADGHSPFAAKGQRIEAYADFIPYWRDGLPIPSGRRMGDDKTPGTIVYETLKNLRSAPDNDLTTLAWLSYFNAIGEQTLRTDQDYKPRDPDLGKAATGGPYLHPAARLRANDLRQVNKIVAATRWADAVARGTIPVEPVAEATDLDLDGEEEYILSNARLFLVFEDDGGRLEYAFGFIPGRGPVQFVGPLAQFAPIFLGPTDWDWTRGEAGQGGPSFFTWDGAFVELLPNGALLVNERYTPVIQEGLLSFVSPDGKVRKSFSLERDGKGIAVEYETSGEVSVKVPIALDPLRMWRQEWSRGLSEIEVGSTMGVRYADGLSATLTVVEGTPWVRPEVVSFLDSPARWEWRHDSQRDYHPGHWMAYPFAEVEVSGSGHFSLRLSVEP